MNFNVSGGNENARINIEVSETDGITEAELTAVFDKAETPERIKVSWKFPAVDCYSTWSPSIRDDHSIQPNWAPRRTSSELARWMPLHGILSIGGENRLLIAVSDALRPIEIETGINEFDSCLDCSVTFFTRPTAPLSSYSTVIRLDCRALPFYECVKEAVGWWETECGYTPAYVPKAALELVNSLWYSYHHGLQADEIVRQCQLSGEYGMKTVIIDDGWQMDESESVSGVYAYCGDWQVSEKKLGDIRLLVDNIHKTGMKAVLWFSVPFIGIKSKSYPHFKNMILQNSGDGETYFALDPRYKEVREYLTAFYVRAVGEWGFDGLKLDFIDSFVASGDSLIADGKCDFSSVEDAVMALLDGVYKKLTALNPEVMLEFRQSYIGPAVRKYGNMLRVGDCPIDAIKNRQDIVNMRLTSGKTAVHSDMVAWNYEDSAESAACQLASILFSVPQISVRLDELNEEHKKMLKFYLGFWKEHRDILLNGILTAENPECNYSSVTASGDNARITAVYADSVVDCTAKYTAAVNVTKKKGLVLEGCAGKRFRIVNCMGEETQSGIVKSEIIRLPVPISGMVFITESEIKVM